LYDAPEPNMEPAASCSNNEFSSHNSVAVLFEPNNNNDNHLMAPVYGWDLASTAKKCSKNNIVNFK